MKTIQAKAKELKDEFRGKHSSLSIITVVDVGNWIEETFMEGADFRQPEIDDLKTEIQWLKSEVELLKS